MRANLRSAASLIATSGLLWGCASNVNTPGADPGGAPQIAPAPMTAAAPAVAAPAGSSAAAGQPAAMAVPSTLPGQPASAMMASPAAPAVPAAAPAAVAAVKVTERGSCPSPNRKVSYHDPCGDDPDPCKINSGFDGDNYCWPAPREGEGAQLHIGPKDYNDPADVQKYIVEPGTEFLNYVGGDNPLTEDKWVNHVQVRMRPGSHHWIISLVSGKIAGGFYDSQGCGSSSVGGIGGGQSLILDNPPQGTPAPEDEGYGSKIPGNSSVCANIHHYNLTDHAQIREVWMNIYFTDEAKVTKRGEGIGMIGATGIAIPPGREQTLTYTARFGGDGRIRSLFGHRHMWTERFAVWVNDGLIYDSWDWKESVTFLYDSITDNPPINTEGKTDGAVSGLVNVKNGDTLKYSCFVKNGSDSTLMFRNDVDTGEMCNLFGGTVGEGTGISANNP